MSDGFVYIADAGPGRVKVGSTTNLRSRSKALRMEFLYEIGPRSDYQGVERLVHADLTDKGFHIEGELFSCTQDIARAALHDASNRQLSMLAENATGVDLIDSRMLKIEQFLKRTAMTESRLGQLACANPRAITGIRSESATIKTFNAVVAYVEANPDGEV